MRISDWSSDVCSSDLPDAKRGARGAARERRECSDSEELRPAVAGGAGRLYRESGQARQQLFLADAADQRRRPVFGSHLSGRRGAQCRQGGEIPCRRSEEHTSELQSLMRISYAVFCLKKKKEKQ